MLCVFLMVVSTSSYKNTSDVGACSISFEYVFRARFCPLCPLLMELALNVVVQETNLMFSITFFMNRARGKLQHTYFIGWTVSCTEQLSMYSVYLLSKWIALENALENLGLTYAFLGCSLTNDQLFGVITTLLNIVSIHHLLLLLLYFDQRLVVWRYYDERQRQAKWNGMPEVKIL